MQKSRLALIVIGVCVLLTAALFERMGRSYHYEPVSYDCVRTPEPVKKLLTFGPNHDAWVISLDYLGDRKHEAGILTICRDEHSSPGLQKYYVWNPADHEQIPPAKGFLADSSDFMSYLDHEVDSIFGTSKDDSERKRIRDRERRLIKRPPAKSIVVGAHELTLMRAYLLLINLDADSDQEIFLVNESQPWRWRNGFLMMPGDVWLGRGTYYVDYVQGRFELKRYWGLGGFLAQSERRLFFDEYLLALALAILLTTMFPRNFRYYDRILGLGIPIAAVGFFCAWHGFIIFVLMAYYGMASVILMVLIALIYFHAKIICQSACG